MFDRSGVSLVLEVVMLAGVVMLVTSVFHVLLMWLAAAVLIAGIVWMFGACIQSRFWGGSGTGLAVPPASEPKKEG